MIFCSNFSKGEIKQRIFGGKWVERNKCETVWSLSPLERERKRECVCVCVCVSVYLRKRVNERKSECVLDRDSKCDGLYIFFGGCSCCCCCCFCCCWCCCYLTPTEKGGAKTLVIPSTDFIGYKGYVEYTIGAR